MSSWFFQYLSDLVRREAPGYESDMPIVFIPEASDKECIPQNRMSSFGFLGNLFFQSFIKNIGDEENEI